MNAVPLSQFMPYGAPELLAAARRHMTQALLAGSALCTLAFVLAGVALTLHPPVPPVIVVEPAPAGHTVLPPPPTIHPPAAAVKIVPSGVTPAGVAVPVPPEQTNPENTIPDQGQLRDANPGPTHADGPPADVGPAPPASDEPVPLEVVTVLPLPVHKAQPDYPEIAIEAGVSGTVLTRILIGRDGRVHDIRIDRSVPMLDEAALTAARQWVFNPALVNGHPVAVWVALPFTFRLH